MRLRRKLYGWLRPSTSSGLTEWCLGRYPPDSPQLPYKVYASMDEAEAAAQAYRANVIWCGAALETRRQLLGE
jgi:hypothetical protein